MDNLYYLDTDTAELTNVSTNSNATTIIDNNFKVLSACIENVNNLVSFLDTIHIVSYFSSSNATEVNTIANFVDVWGGIDNYEAVSIGDISVCTTSAAVNFFTWGNSKVYEGDIVLKMPDASSIIIPGLKQSYYSVEYCATTGNVTYTSQTNIPATTVCIPVNIVTCASIAPIVYLADSSAAWTSTTCATVCSAINAIYPRFYTANDQIMFEDELSFFNITSSGTCSTIAVNTCVSANLTSAGITKIVIEVV